MQSVKIYPGTRDEESFIYAIQEKTRYDMYVNNNIFNYTYFNMGKSKNLYIGDWVDLFLANTKIRNIEFIKAEKLLITSLVIYVQYKGTSEERNNFMIVEMLKAGLEMSYGESALDKMYAMLEPGDMAKKYYDDFTSLAGNSKSLVIKSCIERFGAFDISGNILSFIEDRGGIDGDGIVRFASTLVFNTEGEKLMKYTWDTFKQTEITLLTAIMYYLFYDNIIQKLKYVENPDKHKVKALFNITKDAGLMKARLESLALKCPEHPAAGYYIGFKKDEQPIDVVMESLNLRLSFWNYEER